MIADKENPLLTITDVAEFLRVHRSTIYRLLQHQGLPAIKVGGQWRFSKANVEKWLESRDSAARSPK